VALHSDQRLQFAFCILHVELQSSESLPEQNVKHFAPLAGTGHKLTRVEVETKIDADGADRRSVHYAKTCGRTKVGEVQIARARKHIARIDETGGL
jgi:hypothetical protein